MRIPLSNLSSQRKLENAILFSIILFVFKMIFPVLNPLSIIIINELLVVTTLYFWLIYIIGFTQSKINSPLSIILNAGILNALLFFIISISSTIYPDFNPSEMSRTFLYTLLSTVIVLVFIGAMAYIFSALKELFFLRQKRDPRTYFSTMLIFILLASFSKILAQIDISLEYLFNTFYVVSIILISVNSLRVAWIAFLIKKQKYYLLIISIVLSILFGLNFSLVLSSNAVTEIISDFSPGLEVFLSLIMIYGSIYFGVIFFTTLFHLPTAEAFDRKAEEVSSLMDLTKLITQVFDFKELAETVATTTTKVCNSDAAWLVIKKDDKFELNAVFNIGYLEADKISNSLDLDEEYKDLKSVQIINQSFFKIKVRNDIRKVNFKSIAIAPLRVHTDTSGFLFTARKEDYGFDDDDKKAISAFADFAAVALENAMLIEESIEKERLEKELDVAREIQYKILPSQTPKLKSLDISALFIPAFEVGGDYYDFFELENDRIGFVIADVSGKGISAAFIMAEVKGIFESLSKMIDSPREVLIRANDVLKKSLERKSFVTAIYGIIDTASGVLTFARAGHTPLHILRKDEVERHIPAGIGLGLDYSKKFCETIKEMEIKLNNNDIIALYTDGIVESQNKNLEDFGYDRLDNILAENGSKNLDQISNSIMQSVTVFSQNNSQHDDITLVLFKWNFNNK